MKQRRALLCAILCGLFFCPSPVFSGTQSDSLNVKFKARKKFTQIGYSYNTFSRENGAELKNDLGIFLYSGRSYYLHKPIGGKLRIGLDCVWTDINYSSFKVNYQKIGDQASSQTRGVEIESKDYTYQNTTMHGVDIGMQFGPSVTYSFNDDMQIHTYGRYAPTYSFFYDGDNLQSGFGNFCVIGTNFSWKSIGVGIEGRFGSAKYKNFDIDDESEADSDLIKDGIHLAPNEKGKTKYSGFRAYISFRF